MSSPIDAHIATYLKAIAVEGKTPKTIASYANSLQDLRRVGRQLDLPEDVRAYRVEHVYAFLSALRDRGAAPDYRHRRHREVRACFSWLKRMGYVEENVFGRVPLVKRPQRLQPPFEPEEVGTLLESQDRGRYTALGVTREIVNKTLRRFEAAGTVELGRGRVRVVDNEALENVAEGSPARAV